MQKNSIPALFDALSAFTWAALAQSLDVAYHRVNAWRSARYQPQPAERAALVRAVRRHAKRLLALAEQVEREGKTRQARRT